MGQYKCHGPCQLAIVVWHYVSVLRACLVVFHTLRQMSFGLGVTLVEGLEGFLNPQFLLTTFVHQRVSLNTIYHSHVILV